MVTNVGNHSVTVYPRTASGPTAPMRTLSGAATGLSSPAGVLVDTLYSELVVANFNTNSVTVYPRTASGNTAPIRTVTGPATFLANPVGVGVTHPFGQDELIVSNASTFTAITVHLRTATGNTPRSGGWPGWPRAWTVRVSPWTR